MNSTDFRTMSDVRLQINLERRLAKRRAAEAKRAARFSKNQPVSRWIFWPVVVTFSLVMTFAVAEFAAHVLPMAWRLP